MSATLNPEAVTAHVEVLVRLEAVRGAVDAVLQGRLLPSPRLIESQRGILAKAAMWAKVAEELVA